jgi:hypothetical protein
MAEINAGGLTPPASDKTPGLTPATGGLTTNQPTTPSEGEEVMTRAQATALMAELKQRRLTEEAAVKERDALKKSLMSAEERKEAELAELKTQSQQWEQQRTQLLIDRAVLLLAPTVGIDLELALQLIKPASIKMKDGEVDEESVKKALQALLEKHPTLAVKPAEAASASQQRPPAPRVPSTTPPASSVGQTSQETVKDLKRYTLADAFKQTRQQ